MSEERSSRKSGKGKERKRRKEEEDDGDSEHTTTIKKLKTATTSTSSKRPARPSTGSGQSTSSAPASTEMLNEEEEEEGSGAKPLIFFFQTETADNNTRITDIASRVIEGSYSLSIRRKSFHHKIIRFVPYITSAFLPEDCEPSPNPRLESVEYSKTFAEAFSKLMEWIDTTTAAVSEHEKTEYYPVLATHRGFGFHFLKLLNEMKKSELNTLELVDKNIHFADTQECLREAKKQKHQVAETFESLGLPYLHEVFKPDCIYPENKPEEKVKLLEHIFTQESMVGLLGTPPPRTAEEQVKKWKEPEEVKSLRSGLHGAITESQCKKILKNGMTYEHLCLLRDKCDEFSTFERKLLQRLGSHSKPLIKTLLPFFQEKV